MDLSANMIDLLPVKISDRTDNAEQCNNILKQFWLRHSIPENHFDFLIWDIFILFQRAYRLSSSYQVRR